MKQRLRTAADKRESSDAGFTLVELLVVVIIIGILAAVAIPMFLNQKQKAYESSVKSDLRNAASALETFYVDHWAYPTVRTEVDFEPSDDNEMTMFTVRNPEVAGFVIYGKSPNAETVYVLSSYSGSKPQPTSLETTPASRHDVGPEADLPSGADAFKVLVNP